MFFTFFGSVAGVQHFALTLPKTIQDLDANTDGLIVTTGGQARIDEGMRLLEKGVSARLLITGVGKGVTKSSLIDTLQANPRYKQLLACCVDLDEIALDTKGNASAARKWADRHHLSSLGLVTANYHMPRALLLFRREMPNREITARPVIPPSLILDHWYANWPTAKLLIREYIKYQIAILSG